MGNRQFILVQIAVSKEEALFKKKAHSIFFIIRKSTSFYVSFTTPIQHRALIAIASPTVQKKALFLIYIFLFVTHCEGVQFDSCQLPCSSPLLQR